MPMKPIGESLARYCQITVELNLKSNCSGRSRPHVSQYPSARARTCPLDEPVSCSHSYSTAYLSEEKHVDPLTPLVSQRIGSSACDFHLQLYRDRGDYIITARRWAIFPYSFLTYDLVCVVSLSDILTMA